MTTITPATPTTPTPTPTTFHLFSLLPYELRALIWELTVLPREVDVYIPEPPLRRTTLSSTPVPGPLQACRESRHLLTRRVSTVTNTGSTNTGSTNTGSTNTGSTNTNTNTNTNTSTSTSTSTSTIRSTGSNRSFIGYEKAFQFSVSPLTTPNPGYIYINFQLDLISITSTDLHCFTEWADMLPFKNRIKRLKLERECLASYHGEYFFHNEVNQINAFEGLEECHFVCLDGVWAFEQITEHKYFPCGAENVWLIDQDTGERVRAVELDAKCREERGEEAREWVSDDEEEEKDEWDQMRDPCLENGTQKRKQ